MECTHYFYYCGRESLPRTHQLCTLSFSVETRPEGFCSTNEWYLDRKTLRVSETANIVSLIYFKLADELVPEGYPVLQIG
jgi:hypothetical protein